jgi:hypothetical protein
VNANSVTQGISLRAFAYGGEFELTAVFSYDASEPHEVRMVFHDGLRELNLVISLCPSKGSRAEFTALVVSVACFLEATYWLLAPRAEPARTDIDAGIAAIFAWGAS